MQIKLFSFSRIEKNPKTIEDRINSLLEKGDFKYASLSESSKSGKLNLSVCYDNKKSDIRAKVFKDSNIANLEKNINLFLKDDVKLKLISQSSSSTTIFMIIFYEKLRKANVNKEKNKDQG